MLANVWIVCHSKRGYFFAHLIPLACQRVKHPVHGYVHDIWKVLRISRTVISPTFSDHSSPIQSDANMKEFSLLGDSRLSLAVVPYFYFQTNLDSVGQKYNMAYS